MADIINETSLASGIGQGIGGGIGNILNNYTQNKLSSIAEGHRQSKLAQALQFLPGVNPDMAKGLSALPESILQTVLKEQIQQPRNEAYANALSSILGGNSSQQQE